MNTYQQLWQSLTPLYDADEARAIVRTVLEVKYGMTLTDIICGKITELSADESIKLEEIMARLQKLSLYSMYWAKPTLAEESFV